MPESAYGTGLSRTAAGQRVIVIGAGLSGLFAAVEAARAGAHVRLIARGWGQQIVTPGWISLCDRAEDDVIAEVRGYAALHPDHPYALAGDSAIVDSLDAFQHLSVALGLPYEQRRKDGHNMRLMTALGAIQRPMMAPRGLANGDLSEIDGEALIVGFEGWRDFYPALAAGNLQKQGIAARALTIPLPDPHPAWDQWPTDLANRFDTPLFREYVIEHVRPHVQNAARIGFPAVLGMNEHPDTLSHLGRELGRPVFEIPTLPPSMPGVRLSNTLRGWLLRRRVRVQIGHPVVRGLVEDGHCTGVEVDTLGHRTTFPADHVILATGGLYNGGIESDVTGRLWEPLFGLPVSAPPVDTRAEWYHDHLLIARGHPIHRHTGLRVNNELRPLDASDAPVLDNVYAVGHLLAGFNPLTDGCAEGIALSTAYKAVHTALQLESRTTKV